MSTNPNYDTWEFNELINEDQLNGSERFTLDFVMEGLGLTDAGGLMVEVASGFAYVSGYEVVLGAPDFLTLADGATNHVFLRFDRVADITPATSVVGVIPEAVSNTTGTPPTDSIKLGEVDTAAGVITAIRTEDQRFRIHDAQLETDLGGNHKQITDLVIHKGAALPSTSPPTTAGQLFFRTSDSALFKFDGSSWVEIGAGTVVATNGEATALTLGEAVRLKIGATATVVRAQADSLSDSFLIGFVAETSISAGGTGRIQVVQGVPQTAQFETGLALGGGNIVYLSPTVAGALTNVQPSVSGEIRRVAGAVWDPSAYTGTLPSNSLAVVLLQIEQGTLIS